MLRYLPFLLVLALTIFAFIDCLNTDEEKVRHLPKVVWVIIILLFTIVGPVVWLIAGRPRTVRSPGAGFPRSERPRFVAPDDDPEFLASLNKRNKDNADLLKEWEEDLRRREEELRRESDDPEDGQNNKD